MKLRHGRWKLLKLGETTLGDLLLKLEFSISNWLCKLQCHINHGPEWNVEFSIPIQTPCKQFDCCRVLKMFDFTKQNFLI